MPPKKGIGTFQGYYQEVYLREYSPSVVSWIPSLQIFIAYATVCPLHTSPSSLFCFACEERNPRS